MEIIVDLIEWYEWCEQEWGKPLVIHPQGYDVQTYAVTTGGEPTECYWAILQREGGERYIEFIISATKAISESAGPFVYDCPLYFFELVPEQNAQWREEVKKFWDDRLV